MMMLPAAARRDVAALLALTFLFPVVLCLIFLPTPTDDLREQINVGLNFPLYTWKNPPLQSWIAGLVAQLPVRDAWAYVLVAQVLNFIGLYYLVRTAKEFIGPDSAVPIAIAFCGSIFSSFAVPSTVLNADQIQTPLWLGLTYYALRASRDDRWADWIACGVLAGLSVLAKYFAVVFIGALGLALLAVPSHRIVFRRLGLYAAAAIAIVIIFPHVIAVLGQAAQFTYGMETVQSGSGIGRRLNWLAALVWSLALYGAPLVVALGIVATRTPLRFAAQPGDARRVIVTMVALLLVVLAILILFGGFRYRPRYSEPLLSLGMLALFCFLQVDKAAVQRFARAMLVIVSVMAAGTIALAQVYVVGKQRDPGDSAAALIRAEWDRNFTCGPAYVLGAQNDAYAVGLYVGRGVIGVSPGDFAYGQWVDRQRLREYGAVIVENPNSAAQSVFSTAFPADQPPTRLELPYRRWWRGDTHVYLYRFVKPEKCPAR